MGKQRRRLLNSLTPGAAERQRHKYQAPGLHRDPHDGEVWTARRTLKGALREALEPPGDDSDSSLENQNSIKKESRHTRAKRDLNDDLENGYNETKSRGRSSPPRQSYVLKLFDRSVDLSQFQEDSPLYPICRAWIINQPKANYSELGIKEEELDLIDSVELPGPEGPSISRVPALLPEQEACSKDNINLNYKEAPPPSREQLLRSHMMRWGSVRQAWQEQAVRCEARYAKTQQALNNLNVAGM